MMQMKAIKLKPEREFRFHPTRKWRFDFAFPALMLAVEVEGGLWNRGRHVRPLGYEADCVKYGEAAVLGWRVLRVTSSMVSRGTALDLIERAINWNGRQNA